MKDQKLQKSHSTTRLKILSVICIPLKQQEKTFGVVYLDNRTVKGRFSPEICEFVENFTDFISLAAYSALTQKRLSNQVSALEQELRNKYHFESIIGHDLKMVRILKLITQIADSDATVLIQGESGTGKELVAHALHSNSRRREKAFVAINCGALPENLLESELFGHVKGAFTGAISAKIGWFERANGGTIFLDEVGEMSPMLQIKLLRVLQSGEYSPVGSTKIHHCDLRILAATNQNLLEMIKQGKFREDVYYRLDVIRLELPPLRERRSDIPLLIHYFLEKYNKKCKKQVKQLSSDAESLLMTYNFPGNVRELENAIHRAVTLAESHIIESHHLPGTIRPDTPTPKDEVQKMPFKIAKQRMIEKFEKEYIIECLRVANGNISQAAQIAEIYFKNFYDKMVKYGIDQYMYKIRKKK